MHNAGAAVTEKTQTSQRPANMINMPQVTWLADSTPVPEPLITWAGVTTLVILV